MLKRTMSALLLLSAPFLASADEIRPEASSAKKRVLFLTNSTFHINGGAMLPFNGYSKSADAGYLAFGSYGFLESTRRGKRISPFLKGQVADQRILDLIKRERFAYVVLVTRYNSLQNDDEAEVEIEAFSQMHKHIVSSGAQTVVSIAYVVREKANDIAVRAKNIEMHERLKVAVDKVEIDGKTSPIILAPTGLLWAEGIDQFGMDTWFADAVHGTPLAQHASGCLFFTFITGTEPRNSPFLDLNPQKRFPETELAPDKAQWIRNRIWKLYLERGQY